MRHNPGGIFPQDRVRKTLGWGLCAGEFGLLITAFLGFFVRMKQYALLDGGYQDLIWIALFSLGFAIVQAAVDRSVKRLAAYIGVFSGIFFVVERFSKVVA